jgi:hypothetical protein
LDVFALLQPGSSKGCLSNWNKGVIIHAVDCHVSPMVAVVSGGYRISDKGDYLLEKSILNIG